MHTIIRSRGRVTIPVNVRIRFKIEDGTKICIKTDDKQKTIVLKPITRTYIHSLRGKFRGKGLLKALMKEKHIAIQKNIE